MGSLPNSSFVEWIFTDLLTIRLVSFHCLPRQLFSRRALVRLVRHLFALRDLVLFYRPQLEQK
jgi:hypothetical protein